jgi:hypothetical protein
MAKSNTFTIARNELRRVLTIFGMGEKSIQALFSSMEKSHRHINALSLAAALEKSGMDRDKSANIFRRLGLDDLTINEVFETLDEQRVTAETGRIYDAVLDMGAG